MRVRSLAVLAVTAAACVLGVVGVALAVDGSGSSPVFAVLSGANEVSAITGKKGAGDPDGSGSFTMTVDDDILCYGYTVANLDDPVAAHIHRGRPSENGPVVVPLDIPASGDPGATSGCNSSVDPALLDAILKNPSSYYVNVHTGPVPGGAARGQLYRAG